MRRNALRNPNLPSKRFMSLVVDDMFVVISPEDRIMQDELNTTTMLKPAQRPASPTSCCNHVLSWVILASRKFNGPRRYQSLAHLYFARNAEVVNTVMMLLSTCQCSCSQVVILNVSESRCCQDSGHYRGRSFCIFRIDQNIKL